MKTIEIELTISSKGKSTKEITLPPGVTPGKHRAVLIIEEPISSPKNLGEKFDRKLLLNVSTYPTSLSKSRAEEISHLEEEFADYKKKFPHE